MLCDISAGQPVLVSIHHQHRPASCIQSSDHRGNIRPGARWFRVGISKVVSLLAYPNPCWPKGSFLLSESLHVITALLHTEMISGDCTHLPIIYETSLLSSLGIYCAIRALPGHKYFMIFCFEAHLVDHVWYGNSHKLPWWRGSFAVRRVMLLEFSQYLENYLWPNYDPRLATHAHVMSIVVTVNEKVRERVPVWHVSGIDQTTFCCDSLWKWAFCISYDRMNVLQCMYFNVDMENISWMYEIVFNTECPCADLIIVFSVMTCSDLCGSVNVYLSHESFLKNITSCVLICCFSFSTTGICEGAEALWRLFRARDAHVPWACALPWADRSAGVPRLLFQQRGGGAGSTAGSETRLAAHVDLPAGCTWNIYLVSFLRTWYALSVTMHLCRDSVAWLCVMPRLISHHNGVVWLSPGPNHEPLFFQCVGFRSDSLRLCIF